MRLTARVTDSTGNTASRDVNVAVGPKTRRLAGDNALSGVTVIPAGETWEFDPNTSTTVRINASLILRGTLRMRPARPDIVHLLQFVDVDETQFVGGGHDTIEGDTGLWCDGGALDLQGTPRAGWNRTGNDPTWLPGDELVVAPNKPGDYTFRAFNPALQKVPTSVAADGRAQPTEVFNLTRNVRIEGTPGKRAHVTLGSGRHTLRHFAVRHMGPRKPIVDDVGTEVVLGRYPLHWHHQGEATRGTVVEGVVVRDSSRAFVPHASAGITFRDCVAYQITDDAYWWDPGHPTKDTTYEHCAAFGVKNDPTYRGLISGFLLGQGFGNRIHDCVAVGVKGNTTANGFQWPEFANFDDNVWETTDLVAHNNPAIGIYVWQNDNHPHLLEQLTAYANGITGVLHGAYANMYRYGGVRAWGNGRDDFRHMAFAQKEHPSPQQLDNIYAETLGIGEHAKIITLASCRPAVFRNLQTRRIVRDEKVGTPGNPFGVGSYVLELAPGTPDPVIDTKVAVSPITVVRPDSSTYTL